MSKTMTTDCDHHTLIHLAESPLWVCKGCEGELPIAVWHELKEVDRDDE